MLKFMREQLGKKILMILVAGISLVFVFWGVFPETRLGGGTSGSEVAAVGGEKITAQDLQNAVQREMESYRALGMELPPNVAENIKMGTLESLVQGKLMLVEAKRLGIQVSNAEVTEEIQQLPYFQDKNTKAFNLELYKQVLAANHLSPGQFEENVREGLIHQRMQKFLEDRIRVTPIEVEQEFQVSNDTRDLYFQRFSREDAMKKISVPEKDVEAFLANKDREAQIKGYYAQNNLKYNQPEKVCVRHILKRMDPAAPPEPTAPKEFLDLKPTPANFAAIAKKSSEDPGSKSRGGDLDCFPRGQMDPAFEQAAFSLPVGKVSEPVKSQFGWHYILVTKKIPAKNTPFEEVRREIALELIKREKTDEIRKINLASAEAAAKNWGTQKKETTGPFSRLDGQIKNIGRAPEIISAAFDPKAKIQSGPQVFESQGGVIVASIKEKKSPDMAKFEK
jgi:peptidyl-prolyl cis-trans isomerase D